MLYFIEERLQVDIDEVWIAFIDKLLTLCHRLMGVPVGAKCITVFLKVCLKYRLKYNLCHSWCSLPLFRTAQT